MTEPNTREKSGLQWSVDSLVVAEGRLFSHGWCADPSRTVRAVRVRVAYANGTGQVMDCSYGLWRGDVQAAFGSLDGACGYYVHANLNESTPVSGVDLEVEWADGVKTRLDCSAHWPVATPAPASNAGRPAWRAALRSLASAWRHVRRGDAQSLWAGLARRWSRLGVRAVLPSELERVLALLPADCVLLVDHSLGGGANQFRQDRVRHYRAQQRTVLVWTFVPHLLQHHLALHGAPDLPAKALGVTWDAWRVLLASRRVTQVEFNNCVAYPRQEELGAVLGAFVQEGGARLRVFLHDYHLVCPSHFLLDWEGRFCGVPQKQQCRQCLPRINDSLVALYAPRDIDRWRSGWSHMLALADEIVHFSNSTRELFSRAYPDIGAQQWRLQPHQLPPTQHRFHYPRGTPGLRVAVVGHIGVHKGSQVLLDLVDCARLQQASLEVVVVGTLAHGAEQPGIVQTGSYRRDELCSLLHQHGVQLALMPSICPETFSYVTHELIQLGVPLIGFKIGAQAEALSTYPMGWVVPMGTPQALLQHLQEFKKFLDAAPP